jgi:S-methylmethionine-dependent homocysteine/selenocysteine methylase
LSSVRIDQELTTMTLPHLQNGPFIADGGLETTLVFLDGLELPDFAAFPLLDDADGLAALQRYYAPYLDIAEQIGTGIVLDTPTWRANLDWAARLGYDAERLAEVNRRAVAFVRELAATRPAVVAVANGVLGPRGDGYVVGSTMSAAEAAQYHALQCQAFAEAGADMVTAVTMTYAEEACGITRAAVAAGLPVAVSFTVETDGRLPSGQGLGDAIGEVDAATGRAPAYYMVNCAHPTHFAPVLEPGAPWSGRIRAIRANASTMSHAELDNATELDRGDPADLAARYRELRALLGELAVVGGCCGTDHEHVAAIAGALVDRA